MTQWAVYKNASNRYVVTLKHAPSQLPWQCPMRFSGMSQNCGCARFEDGSCVPPHIMPDYERRRDAAYAAKTRGHDGSWHVDRHLADVAQYQWGSTKQGGIGQ